MGNTYGRPSGGVGGGTTDALARASIDAVRANTGDVVAPGGAVLATDNNLPYINNTAGNITTSGATSAALLGDGLTLFGGASSDPEVIENAGVLAGAVPAGAKVGVDTSTGAVYYSNGGNWAAVPSASVDLNTVIGDTVAGNYGGGAPNNPPATADAGDILVEFYDDVTAYFTATGVNTWPAAAQKTVSLAQVDEVIEAAGALVGGAPAGAQLGIDTTTGVLYYVDGGNWTLVPTASVDLSTTVVDQQGANYAGGAPSAAPATADQGDVHIEIYDDVVAYFTATANDTWPNPAQITVNRAATPLYQTSTAQTNMTHGQYWIAGHEMVFPDSPSAGQWVVIAPNGGDWLSSGASFSTTDTASVAAGQTSLLAGSDELKAVYDAVADNWAFFVGGGAGSSATEYATVAALPAAAGQTVGDEAKVTNDPTPANNGFYIVANDGGGNFWVK